MHERYPDHHTPADLDDAKELLFYCMDRNIVINLKDIRREGMVADLLLVKCMELAKYADE